MGTVYVLVKQSATAAGIIRNMMNHHTGSTCSPVYIPVICPALFISVYIYIFIFLYIYCYHPYLHFVTFAQLPPYLCLYFSQDDFCQKRFYFHFGFGGMALFWESTPPCPSMAMHGRLKRGEQQQKTRINDNRNDID